MIVAIVFLLLYILFPYMLLGICRGIAYSVRRSFRQKMRIRGQVEQKPSLTSKFNEAISFVFKEDNRAQLGFSNKAAVGIIYVLGLAGTLFFAFQEMYLFAIISLFVPFIAGIVAIVFYAPIKQERELVTEKLFEIKQNRMGLSKSKKELDPSKEVKVVKWKEDLVNPELIEFSIPTSFDPLGCEAFMEQFNVYFGKEATWVADKTDGKNGWDFTKFKLSICQTAPLPSRADWSERYLNKEEFAWSFFPLGLGSENGVKIYNEENQREEFVLGFDLSGAQVKLAKKKGIQIGSDIVMAPQVLISGGTGGGKALDVDTPIAVIKKD